MLLKIGAHQTWWELELRKKGRHVLWIFGILAINLFNNIDRLGKVGP